MESPAAPLPPRIIVYSLAHAESAVAAAAESGSGVALLSPAAAASSAGAPWFQALVAMAARNYPGTRVIPILDCGDAVGYALGALQGGVPVVRVTGTPETLERLTDIAGRLGARVDTAVEPALDLLDRQDVAAACAAWLRKL
ncbi:MAG: hypothetical protein HQL37_02945 [Alphaproteobacteria bacterium]|nr:hypothetical protein [Alphaproteobacteria bacterium]